MVDRARRLHGTGSVAQGTHRHRVPDSRGTGVHGELPASYFLWRRGSACTSFWRSVVALVIALPWHVLATMRNPPYFAFSMHAGPGEYRGFFWFYFFNEHLLRFLNLRYPRDYNTVPRLLFWALNLVWLFPWSVYLLATPTLSYTARRRGLGARG